jgi:hypothetical protein
MAKDKPVYAFIRKGNTLVPEMEMDLAAVQGIQEGQRVIVDIKHGRNLARLRAYWAQLQECIDATGCAPSKEALDAYIRTAVGFIEMVHVNGQWVPVPRHINTSQCEEPEMIAFFDKVNERLASDFGFVSERKSND